MPTIFTKGDLFATDKLDAFAFGVSSAGTMDAGTAIAYRKKWPAMFDAYKAACGGKSLTPGDVFAWSGGGARVYGLVLSKTETETPTLAAFMKAFTRMLELAAQAKAQYIGMPRIGTKTARTEGPGLDWTRMKKVLAETGDTTPLTIVVVEQFIRAKDALAALPMPEVAAHESAAIDDDGDMSEDTSSYRAAPAARRKTAKNKNKNAAAAAEGSARSKKRAGELKSKAKRESDEATKSSTKSAPKKSSSAKRPAGKTRSAAKPSGARPAGPKSSSAPKKSGAKRAAPPKKAPRAR